MKTLTPFLFVPVTLGWALPGPGQPGEDARLGGLGPRRTDTVDQVASHVVSLQRVSHQQHPRTYWANSLARYLENRIDRLAADADPAQWTPLRLVQNNSYTAVIEIGGEKLEVIVDTGSSDTWVLQKNYACYGLDNRGIRRKVSVRSTRPLRPACYLPSDPGRQANSRVFPLHIELDVRTGFAVQRYL